MPIDRRRFITGALTGVVVLEAPLSAYGLDAVPLGVRPGAAEDQSRPLLRALEQASRTRAPLMLAPGAYRVGDIKLPDGAQLFGVRGATRLLMTRGPSLLSSEGGNNITIGRRQQHHHLRTDPGRRRAAASATQRSRSCRWH